MKILKAIKFDNGFEITFDHESDCCERNYADFQQLEELAYEVEFDEDLTFEPVSEHGFRFGSKGTPMFFIPCYSYQNGYYTKDIDIYYNGKKVIAGMPCSYEYSDGQGKNVGAPTTKELIKEMKRNIINGYRFADEEREIHNEDYYEEEHLALSLSLVIYSRTVIYNSTEETHCCCDLCSAKDFLKMPIAEIEKLINKAVYYNTQGVEYEN